jgi:hypothetical protein
MLGDVLVASTALADKEVYEADSADVVVFMDDYLDAKTGWRVDFGEDDADEAI